MPVFTDSNNRIPFVKEGDYKVTVTAFKIGISTGQKTAGCDQYDLELEVEGENSKLFDTLWDLSSCAWKIDTFLKSAGIKLAKGQAFTFDKDCATAEIPFIDPIGLRCNVYLVINKYTSKSGQEVTNNKIGCYYTDKPALPRVVIVAPPVAAPYKTPTGPIEDDDVPF